MGTAISQVGAATGGAVPGRVRLRGLLLAGGCLAVLAAAGWLKPHASGTGTHQELGLPPCAMLSLTGWPCPTCGLTTSVSALVHGRWALAFKAHPFGLVLLAGVAALLAAGVIETLTGRSVFGRLRRPALWGCAVLIALGAGWGLKVLLGLADGSLPMR